MGTLGLNRTFAIKNADGTPFHDLVLHKATYDSVVMSLAYKITGDVMYKDNTLAVTMQEYIEYKRNPDDDNEEPVRFVLVNPPTVVKEGIVGDNGVSGMTKYSFEFYHPMCALSNFPFTDVAVKSGEGKFLAQNKTFSWMGNGFDMMAKLNKNLQGTQWVVVSSGNDESEAKMMEMSEVLSFDNQYISDVLKTSYETWKVPFVIDSLKEGEYFFVDENNNRIDYYSIGKRFVIVVGLPSNEIYEAETMKVEVDTYIGGGEYSQSTPIHVEEGDIIDITKYTDGVPLILDSSHSVLATEFPYTVDESRDIYIGSGGNKTSVTTVKIKHPQVYVFRFGQGVGLKNNSRTPKNNKIVTRLAGYGSENNIPYGYPQIRWYGDQDWDYTINNDPTADGSYPIYKGIVDGRYVKLIKHPFTRKTLMPSVYVQTLFNKVSPYAERIIDSEPISANPNYNPSTTIVDYYDADGSYPNPIVLSAPSYEIHQFENIKPELGDAFLALDAEPYDANVQGDSYKSWAEFTSIINELKNNTSIESEKVALQECYDAFYKYSDKEIGFKYGGSYTYNWEVKRLDDKWQYCTAKYTSNHVNFFYTVLSPNTEPWVPKWDDSMDDDGNYKQSYFKVTLPQLDFDLYACASITEEMKINMRGGACIGCTFNVMVDWEDYKKNFYDESGNFDPEIGEGHPRNGERYPDTSKGEVDIIVQKDIETFGTIMPNIYQQPKAGDKFVILGISLPQTYVTNAEARLDEAMREYMLENNVYYYDYPLKFDEFFLAKHTAILEQIRNNAVVTFKYGDELPMKLYVKQMTIKYGDKPLPQYDITLTDDVEIVLNKIGQVTDDVSRMRVQVSELQKYYSGNIEAEIRDKLSRVYDDVAQGRITFQQGLNALASVVLSDEIRSNYFSSGLYGGSGWRIDQLGNAELESLRVRSYLEIVELLVNRMQAQEGDTIFAENDQIEKVDVIQVGLYVLSLKEKYAGYVTAQQRGNVIKGIINTVAAKNAGLSDVTTTDAGEYYTSWMQVVATHTDDNTLGTNQIRVVLYGNAATPSGRNFPPCELMTLTRWGSTLDPEEEDISTAEMERRRRLRSSFYISTSEGRIVKLNNVYKPILESSNYGTTLGLLPDFVKEDYKSIAARISPNRDYLYAQGVVVEDFIKIDREGEPLTNYVDCGEWVDGSTLQEPTEGYGIYLFEEFNENTGQYETHDVWHNNAKWRCLQHEPVTIEGVSTYYEPTEANSIYWEKLEEGVKGDDGVTYDIEWVDADSKVTQNIPCDSNGNTKKHGAESTSMFLQATLYKREGDGVRAAFETPTCAVYAIRQNGTELLKTQRNVSTISITEASNVNGYLGYRVLFRNSSGRIVSESYIYKTYDGAQGERGKKGRFYYYAGDFDANDDTTEFNVNDSQSPYFHYNDNYWVYNPDTNPPSGTITMHDMGTPSSSSADWEIMYDDFKYIITEALFSDYASLGASIIKGDWMFSRYGTLYRFPFKAIKDNGSWEESEEPRVFAEAGTPDKNYNVTLKFAVDDVTHKPLPSTVEDIDDVPQDFYHYKYDEVMGLGRFFDGEPWDEGDSVGGQPPFMYFQEIFEEDFANFTTQHKVYPVFIPTWCVNFKTGAMRMANGKVRVQDDGALISSGFSNKNVLHVTEENFDIFFNSQGGVSIANLRNIPDIIKFEYIPYSNLEIYLPSFVYGSPSTSPTITLYGDSLDDVRSFIGREIIIYNDTTSGVILDVDQAFAQNGEYYHGSGSGTSSQWEGLNKVTVGGGHIPSGAYLTLRCISAVQVCTYHPHESGISREAVIWEKIAGGFTAKENEIVS